MSARVWSGARLGDVCDLNPRRPELRRPDAEPTSFVPMAAVAESGKGILRIEERPYAAVRKGYTFFAEGDILFAKITPCMQNGKHAIARGLRGGIGFASTEFHVVRPRPEAVIAEWVHYFLLHPGVLLGAEASCSGAVGQQRVPPSFLADLRIPVLPLGDQRRIAARLTEQLAAVERARAAATAKLAAAQDLEWSFLRAAFASSEAAQWPRRRLGDIALLERGRFGARPRNDARFYGGQYRWIQIGEVERAAKYVESFSNTLNAEGLATSKLFRKGTLVLSIAASIGAVGILGFDACMPDSLVAVTPRPGLSDTEFLYYVLRYIRPHLRSLAPQMAQANLKLGMLNPLEIPLPALSRQRSVVESLEEQFGSALALAADARLQLAAINALPPVLLRETFKAAS